MRFSSPATIHQLAFQRLKSEPAGSALRALLGAAGASVIPATELGKAALPPRPFVAYRPGATTNVLGIDQHQAAWWVYDDPAQGTWRIDQVVAALAPAYLLERGAAPLPSPAGPVRLVAADEPREDLALGLRCRRVTLAIDA
ncbi:MAG TPA: hypothetical protein PKD53_04755 [Chloroflexaceae bacterium]|nr:hypothetical protein [Chloroflexaceae bacterium]